MKKKSFASLLSAATCFVAPFVAKSKPVLTLAAPTIDLDAMRQSAPRAVMAMPMAKAQTVEEVVAEINTAFTAYKASVEAQMAGKADIVAIEQIERINDNISALMSQFEGLSAKQAALALGGGGSGASLSPEASAHADAFDGWFRRGREPDAGMRSLEVAAKLTTQSDPDGAYLVPTEMEGGIDRVLGTVSAVRGAARVINVSTSEYKKLVSLGGATSGWVGEDDDRAETATPVLREIAINTGEIYANPYATQTMLDDAIVDVAGWLAEEVSIDFAEKESDAFINGNGVKKPRGFLTYDTVDNSSYGMGKTSAFGKIGFVKTGNAGTLGTQADAIIDLYYALRSGYRTGASFITSDAVMGTIRKMKDGEGNYLWAPPTAVDMPATFLGKPVITDDYMPGVANGAFPIAFANFKRAYTIIDRMGIRVLRDPYTKKPFVGFYTTKRVGGGVTNFEAIKLLKVAA